MKKCLFRSALAAIFVLFFVDNPAMAGEAKKDQAAVAPSENKIPKVERIGGTFVVTSIKPLKGSGFRVIFSAKEGTPRFKTLVLDSPHVHMSLTEGASLRLSADVIATTGDTAEISQVVVFVPSRGGNTPVWMLSKRAVEPVPPARLLDMHDPHNDYQVF